MLEQHGTEREDDRADPDDHGGLPFRKWAAAVSQSDNRKEIIRFRGATTMTTKEAKETV
jgi:hypothetical protein